MNEEVQSRIEAARGEISLKRREYDTIKMHLDALESQKRMLTEEMGSLSLFQFGRKKELREEIASLVEQMTEVESDLTIKEREMTALGYRIQALERGSDIEDEVQAYIMANFFEGKQKISAIKYYRENTGVGLAEAKLAVEQMFEGTYDPQNTQASAAVKMPVLPAQEQIMEYIKMHFDRGSKIQAIAYYRQQTGASLKEAKEVVDRIV
ncbi:MAG: hypothetical protein IJ917_05345 [Firmicutes bacterium]|nr:hypothetical protein [Bacillota bacterium]